MGERLDLGYAEGLECVVDERPRCLRGDAAPPGCPGEREPELDLGAGLADHQHRAADRLARGAVEHHPVSESQAAGLVQEPIESLPRLLFAARAAAADVFVSRDGEAGGVAEIVGARGGGELTEDQIAADKVGAAGLIEGAAAAAADGLQGDGGEMVGFLT